MPDINHPLVVAPFSTGATLEADRVSEGLHNPKSTPDSMSVINGRLDEDNLATPYSITNDVVRPGAMATGGTSGQTVNTDFFSDFFFGDYDATDTSACPYPALDRALTVVSRRFYVPYACSLISLHWHVGVIVDGGHLWNDTLPSPAVVEDIEHLSDTIPNRGDPSTARNLGVDNTVLGLFLDGNPIQPCTRHIRTGLRSMLGSKYYGAGLPPRFKPLEGSPLTGANEKKYWNIKEDPDHRWWSGHYNATEGYMLTKGWHTASIRVTNGKWPYATTTQASGDPLAKVVPHVRFKTCNMTAIPIR